MTRGIHHANRLVALLSSPIILIIAGGALVLDWLSLPYNNWHHSVAGRWHGNWSGRSTAQGRPLAVRFIRNANGVRAEVAYPGDLGPDGMPLRVFVFEDLPRRYGWWALTSEVHRIFVDNPERDMTPGELAMVPQLTASVLESEPGLARDTTIDMLKTGQLTRSRVLVSGYVHNAVALVLAATVAISTPLCLARFYRHVRSERWRKQERCAACGFTLRSLPGTRCPECGHANEPMMDGNVATPSNQAPVK